MRPLYFVAVAVAACLRNISASPAAEIVIDTPMSPPVWALLQRQLLDVQADACREFFAKYFDDRGFLLCVERWGGDDGPDDAIENCNDWPLLYALGADDVVRQMVAKAWEGHLWQYTQAKTVDVPLARDGMYYKEFPVMFDWVHNGEGQAVFTGSALANPNDPAFVQRVRRFAGFYMNEDPGAPNYDPQYKIIRSLFNGSRGPLLRKATALDWAGDPIEIENRFHPKHGEKSFAEMLAHFEPYTDIVGDHPQNLRATTLGFLAFAATHDEKYKRWLLEYVDAWRERAAANNDVMPSNIGLDGKIGGATNGKWYGGTYGWAFTVTVPPTMKPQNRNTTAAGFFGFMNAFMLTGDEAYLDVWRKQTAAINSQARTIDGKQVYPRMFGDDGWYGWTPEPYAEHALFLYCLSLRDDDRERVPKSGWLDFLAGKNPDYPEQALRRDLERMRSRAAAMREDATTPDTRLADDPIAFNPASVHGLLETAMGCPHPGIGNNILCAALRYFDPARQRPGLPEDVATLVSRMTADEIDLTLVNVNPVKERTVVVQTGAYGEHEITAIIRDGEETKSGGSSISVRLAPGTGEKLTIRWKRHANKPTLAFPFPG